MGGERERKNGVKDDCALIITRGEREREKVREWIELCFFSGNRNNVQVMTLHKAFNELWFGLDWERERNETAWKKEKVKIQTWGRERKRNWVDTWKAFVGNERKKLVLVPWSLPRLFLDPCSTFMNRQLPHPLKHFPLAPGQLDIFNVGVNGKKEREKERSWCVCVLLRRRKYHPSLFLSFHTFSVHFSPYFLPRSLPTLIFSQSVQREGSCREVAFFLSLLHFQRVSLWDFPSASFLRNERAKFLNHSLLPKFSSNIYIVPRTKILSTRTGSSFVVRCDIELERQSRTFSLTCHSWVPPVHLDIYRKYKQVYMFERVLDTKQQSIKFVFVTVLVTIETLCVKQTTCSWTWFQWVIKPWITRLGHRHRDPPSMNWVIEFQVTEPVQRHLLPPPRTWNKTWTFLTCPCRSEPGPCPVTMSLYPTVPDTRKRPRTCPWTDQVLPPPHLDPVMAAMDNLRPERNPATRNRSSADTVSIKRVHTFARFRFKCTLFPFLYSNSQQDSLSTFLTFFPTQIVSAFLNNNLP